MLCLGSFDVLIYLYVLIFGADTRKFVFANTRKIFFADTWSIIFANTRRANTAAVRACRSRFSQRKKLFRVFAEKDFSVSAPKP